MSDDVTGARKGDYLILGTLGAGGMGKVYKVRNTLSDRVEAMKVLLPDLSEQQDLADRFLREIKVLASLHHPNIAELRTALTINNQLVMIMEYVEGATLAARLQQGPIRYADALVYFDQVLAALSCAHGQRIVHRDIKPANIMLAPYGVVKLMDFGIARSGNDHGLTMTGTTLGSVAYMSPEQVRCEPLDGRSDLYSIGVSLYETITGQRPYVSDNNFEVMQAHLQVPATPPLELKPDIPPVLSQLILMAMAKDPAQRFQTADALRAALRSVAPALGEPTPIPAMVTDSALDLTAPPTPRTAAPSTPRAATARPLTARPVTARPVTAQPLASAAASAPLAATIPLSGVAPQHSPSNAPAHSPANPQPQFPAAATAQASAGNRRGIYVALSALGVVVMLIAGGFSARRWLHAHPFDHSATAPASAATTAPALAPGPAAVAPVAPVTPAAQTAPGDDPAAAVLKALPCKTDDWRCWSKLPDGTPGKPATVASAKPQPSATSTRTPTAPRQDTSRQDTLQQSASQVNPPQPSTPPQTAASVKQDNRAAEQSTRKTVATVAQLAALEHEEFDELSSRANKVNARIAAQQQAGQQTGADVAASQQRARNYLQQAQSALQIADVQNAQKYMEQADAELTKIEKTIGH
jgi:eukaryotic-like serine/threonine-protein kinase